MLSNDPQLGEHSLTHEVAQMFPVLWWAKDRDPMVLAASRRFAGQVNTASHHEANPTDIEAISAMDRTQQNMPKQTARNTHTAPAGPPFGNERRPVLGGQSGPKRALLPWWFLHECERPCQTDNHSVSDQGHHRVHSLSRSATAQSTTTSCRKLTFSSCGLCMRCISKSSAGVPGTWATTTLRPATVSTIFAVAMRR